NRVRYEEKWGRAWSNHDRQGNETYDVLVERVRDLVARAVPDGSTALVCNRGDDTLLELGDREGWHFPRDDEGEYAGYYPSDSAEAIEQVERQRSLGAEYL